MGGDWEKRGNDSRKGGERNFNICLFSFVNFWCVSLVFLMKLYFVFFFLVILIYCVLSTLVLNIIFAFLCNFYLLMFSLLLKLRFLKSYLFLLFVQVFSLNFFLYFLIVNFIYWSLSNPYKFFNSYFSFVNLLTDAFVHKSFHWNFILSFSSNNPYLLMALSSSPSVETCFCFFLPLVIFTYDALCSQLFL